MKEVWKPIKEFESYQVSNFGEVKSFKRKTPMLLRQHAFTKNGRYLYVTLKKKGKSYPRYVHKLVAEYFLPEIEGIKWVNHKDGNSTNNVVENLEWSNPKHNYEHARYVLGTIKPEGENCNFSVLTEAEVVEILKSEGSYASLGRKYNVHRNTIRLLKLGKTWKHLANSLMVED